MRERLRDKLAHRLERFGSPHVVMLGLLTAAGLTGFVCSVLLGKVGVDRLALRYMVAVACAYGTFLGLLALWMHRQTALVEACAEEIEDHVRLNRPPGEATEPESRQGVASASASQGTVENADLLVEPLADAASAAPTFFDSGPPLPGRFASGIGRASRSRSSDWGWWGSWSSSSSSVDASSDSDGCGAILVVLLLVVLAVTLIAMSFYFVVIAPVLLAELVLDGLLTAALARRAIRVEPGPHWLAHALRHTAGAAIVLVLLFGLLGWTLQQAAPEAHSLGDALHRIFGR